MKNHMNRPGAHVVSAIGGASVVLAAFVLVLVVFRPPFRDIHLLEVLAINFGLTAIFLLVVHMLLIVVPRWRHRATLWILVAWVVIVLGYWTRNWPVLRISTSHESVPAGGVEVPVPSKSALRLRYS
jgi:hypothetical protein